MKLLLLGKAISEEKDNVRKTLEGVDLIFLLAGLGGGTGGGATPEIARLARETGALVFAFVPMPFSWEKGDMPRPKIHWPNLGSLQMR